MIIKEQIQEQFGGALSSAQGGFPWKNVVYTVIVLLGLAFVYLFIFKEVFRRKFLSFLSEVLQGIFSIFRCGRPFAYVGHTLLIWVSYILMFALPFYSLDQTSHVPFTGILLGFIAGSLGITFTNGGIGTYPLLVGLVVTFYIQKQYPQDAQAVGNALGMLIWATQTVLMILLGLISLWLLPRNYSKENDENTAGHQA
jgi:hypothetical protein